MRMSILHIVYDDKYNVGSLGAVGSRYAAALEHLKTSAIADTLQIHPPTEYDVAASHDPEYLESLKDTEVLRGIFELDIAPTEEELLAIKEAQRLQYCGTQTAADLALKHGFAVNLGGGLHHASRGAGSGFCLYNDITAATERLLETGKAKRILIVDLDAHQGNGYEEDLWPLCQTGNVCIFDAYEPLIFPFPAGEAVKQSIHYYIPYMKDDRGDCFIDYLVKGIELPFQEFQPDFVIYNAGTDTMEGDPVTHLGQTAEAIKDRDVVVVESWRRRGIPVLMCMSGGYGAAVPKVVAESLCNILNPPKVEWGQPDEEEHEDPNNVVDPN